MINAFAAIVGLTVTASVMAILILILRRVLKRTHIISRSAFVCLWLLVFLRLCIPFGFDLDLGSAEGGLPSQVLYKAIYEQVYNGQDSGSVAAGSGLSAGLSIDAGNGRTDSRMPERVLGFEDGRSGALVSGPASSLIFASRADLTAVLTPEQTTALMSKLSAAAADQPAQPEQVRGAVPASAPVALTFGALIPILTIIWAAGAAALVIFFLISYIVKINRIKGLCDKKLSAEILLMAEAAKLQTGIKRKVKIKVSDSEISGVYGIVFPAIVLNKQDIQGAQIILLHEMTHIKNHDNLKKVLSAAALSIHWFNPVIWIAVKSFCRDIEMVCDERVVKLVGNEGKKNYAVVLMDSARVEMNPGFSYFGQSPLSERIKHILGMSKKQIASPVICIAVAAFLFLGCFASPAKSIAMQISSSADPYAAYELVSEFLNLDISFNDNNASSLIDYAPSRQGAVFLLEEDADHYRFLKIDSDSNIIWEARQNKEGREFAGSIYSDDSGVYFTLRKENGSEISNKIYKLGFSGGAMELVYETKAADASMKLFGGGNYLCWYEGNSLIQFDAAAKKIENVFETNGNQDYGAILDDHLAWQYTKPVSGKTVIRCVDLATGDYYEAKSSLGEETYSVYGNGQFAVYKEAYSRGADIYIYNAATETTISLWDFVAREDSEALRDNFWGISLVGDRLILSGNGSNIHSVNLINAQVQALSQEDSGVGYYASKNTGNLAASMLFKNQNDMVDKTGSIYVGRMVKSGQ